MISEWAPIRASLTLLLGGIGIFVTAFAIRTTFLANIVPIAAAEQTQPLWALETAFFLKALENIAVLGVALVLVAAVARWAGRRKSS
jgi:hypothetical protein